MTNGEVVGAFARLHKYRRAEECDHLVSRDIETVLDELMRLSIVVKAIGHLHHEAFSRRHLTIQQLKDRFGEEDWPRQASLAESVLTEAILEAVAGVKL